MYSIKIRKCFKNILLSKTFKEHPVSVQPSFKIIDLILFAILEDSILIRLSLRLDLIPPTNEILDFKI